MFPGIEDSSSRIGDRNVVAIENILIESGIAIMKKEVGGEHGRSVNFNLDTGEIIVEGTGV